MTRWVTTTQPAAQLEQEPGEPLKQSDGTEVTYFRTAFGKRFARVVEKQGFTFWMREIDTP
jgi:hypothetical protein